MPRGSKLWRIKYRLNGKEKLLSLGKYPIVSLAEAREHLASTLKKIKQGEDPAAEKKKEKIASPILSPLLHPALTVLKRFFPMEDNKKKSSMIDEFLEGEIKKAEDSCKTL